MELYKLIINNTLKLKYPLSERYIKSSTKEFKEQKLYPFVESELLGKTVTFIRSLHHDNISDIDYKSLYVNLLSKISTNIDINDIWFSRCFKINKKHFASENAIINSIKNNELSTNIIKYYPYIEYYFNIVNPNKFKKVDYLPAEIIDYRKYKKDLKRSLLEKEIISKKKRLPIKCRKNRNRYDIKNNKVLLEEKNKIIKFSFISRFHNYI